MKDESGLNRKNIVDNRVHCCLYFISPYGHGLKTLDVDFMKQLSDKVNIVPVIGKTEMMETTDIRKLKTRIMEEIGAAGIRIYQLPEDEEYKVLRESVPFAVCGANAMVEEGGKKVCGRIFRWGIIDTDNPEHCDNVKLRSMLITHMQDLQEVTHDLHYENFRSDRLAEGGGESSSSVPAVSAGGSAPPPGRTDQKDKLLAEKDQELAEKDQELAE